MPRAINVKSGELLRARGRERSVHATAAYHVCVEPAEGCTTVVKGVMPGGEIIFQGRMRRGVFITRFKGPAFFIVV